ncbi:hypothetical protein [Streptomyces cinerochromogenes]|uniref:hypothetical protein n=1 Tax=Streptomyces cinerochromogenes TaxID=66422 RepID=UPI0033B568D6
MPIAPTGHVLGPYLDDRKQCLDPVLRPLREKTETLYVLPGSAAQWYAERRFPHQPTKEVGGGRRPHGRHRQDPGPE